MPVLAIGLVLVVAPLLRWLDRATGWTLFNFTSDGARTVLGAFTSSMLTLVVFVVSSLLIVVQLASAKLTPRIIARVFAERRLKWVLGTFTFAYTYTIAASGRIEETTPQLLVAFAIFFNLVCIALFFWFVQWLGGSLRPIAVLQAVAEEGPLRWRASIPKYLILPKSHRAGLRHRTPMSSLSSNREFGRCPGVQPGRPGGAGGACGNGD